MATKQAIIDKFHLFMDDTSDLSTQEESDLFDKIYQEVASDRPWEILKKAFTGTQSITVPTVALPSDFGYLVQNHNYTQNNAYAELPVVFVGTSYTPYPVVSWSDRRQYRSQNVAYIDAANSTLVFANQPTAANPIEYDYASVPAALTSGQSPVFPSRFHDIIYHGMCVDSFIIQQSDKAKSYKAENKARYDDYLNSMALWNANLIQQ